MTLASITIPGKKSMSGDGKPGYIVLMLPATTDVVAREMIRLLKLPDGYEITELKRINHPVQVGGNIFYVTE